MHPPLIVEKHPHCKDVRKVSQNTTIQDILKKMKAATRSLQSSGVSSTRAFQLSRPRVEQPQGSRKKLLVNASSKEELPSNLTNLNTNTPPKKQVRV